MKPVELELVIRTRVDLGLIEYRLGTLQKSPGPVLVAPSERDHSLAKASHRCTIWIIGRSEFLAFGKAVLRRVDVSSVDLDTG